MKDCGFCFTPFCAFCAALWGCVEAECLALPAEESLWLLVRRLYTGLAAGLSVDLLRAVWYCAVERAEGER